MGSSEYPGYEFFIANHCAVLPRGSIKTRNFVEWILLTGRNPSFGKVSSAVPTATSASQFGSGSQAGTSGEARSEARECHNAGVQDGRGSSTRTHGRCGASGGDPGGRISAHRRGLYEGDRGISTRRPRCDERKTLVETPRTLLNPYLSHVSRFHP
jgi:hypothetical protein